jgi:hypothetical protein
VIISRQFWEKQNIRIATLKNRTLNPAAQLFIKCAREVAKAMAGVPAAIRRTSTKLSVP